LIEGTITNSESFNQILRVIESKLESMELVMYPKPVLYKAKFEGGPLGGMEFSVEVGQLVLISVEAAEVPVRHTYEVNHSTKNFKYKRQEPGIELCQ
jgi:hypothetical protein